MLAFTSLIVLWSMVNWTRAYNWMNEDPSFADPDGAIACDNLLPPFNYRFPLNNQDLHEPTVLEICAQTQYGGQEPPYSPSRRSRGIQFNVGAYCNATRGRVVFEERRIHLGNEVSLSGINKSRLRLLAYCLLRCRCSNIPSANIEPLQLQNERDASQKNQVNRVDELFALDLLDDHLHNTDVIPLKSMELLATIMAYVNSPTPVETQYARRVGVEPENEIVCNGPLPSFALPEPAQRTDFNNLTELCAVGLIGGKATMNAGAFCYRNFGGPPDKPLSADVWFSDEMTPLVTWTWSFGRFTRVFSSRGLPPRPLLLRRYCWQKCRCKDPRWTKRQISSPMIYAWPYIIGDVEHSQWFKFYSSHDTSESESSSQDNSERSSSQQSLQDTLKSLRGFLPDPTEKRLDAMLGTSDPSTCDDQCYSPADCVVKSSSSCPFQPQCRVDPKSLTETVMGSLAKVSLAYAASACLPKHSRQRLGGRDVENNARVMAMNDWPCACNVTYVSHACCESDTGQIWEPSRNSFGGLKR